MPQDLRVCKVCDTPKSLDAFSVRGGGKYLYRLRTCDECQKEKDRVRAREYTEKNREQIKRRARIARWDRYQNDEEFREKVKENARTSSQKYYQKNRERILAQRKERRKAKTTCAS